MQGISGAAGPRLVAPRSVLLVGEAYMAPPFDFATEPAVTFAVIGDVGAELIESLQPAVILSPLFSRGFDCVDLAQILHDLGYRGAYRAFSPLLPSPELIRREVRAMCPGLSFDLVLVPPTFSA